MKRILVVTVIIALSLSIVQAQEIRPGGNIALGYTSNGINDASGISSHGQFFYQGIEFYLQSLTWDLYIGALNFLNMENSQEKKDSNQACYNAGITKRFFGSDSRIWKIDTGYTFYDLYGGEGHKNNLHAIYLSLEFPEIGGIILFGYFERDIAAYKKECEERQSINLFKTGLCYSFKIFKQPIYPEISVAGHGSGFGYSSESASSAKAKISTVFQFSNLQIIPQVTYQKRLRRHPDNEEMIKDEHLVWGTITINFSF